GYQYDASNGQSPPPFTEKIPTYELRVRGGRIEVDPTPKPAGTPTTPITIPTEAE
ncbi:MAG: (2Fe-2S)-binding protein, partial [Phycisphaerales bacterium]|nr:(2Fe-2S)-binding protein [Phycisphaerales bacterium]